MKVVITGGAGFIGLNLARRRVVKGALTGLSGETEEIDGIVLFDAVTPEARPPGLDGRVDIVTGDVSDRDTVPQQPDAKVEGEYENALSMSACDAVDGSHHRHRNVPKCGSSCRVLDVRFWL